jgi:hypothetical protein
MPQVRPLCRANLGSLWENGVVEIESEWAARDRELKIFGGPARTLLCPIFTSGVPYFITMLLTLNGGPNSLG